MDTRLDFLNFFPFDPAPYSTAIHLVTRLIGVIYVIAYIPFLFQMRGLFGKEGIKPIGEYLQLVKNRFGKWRFYYAPTLWWINASDFALYFVIVLGIVLGTALAFGFYPSLLLVLLYFIHLSLTSAGQDFLGFGWETFLMEVSIALFLTIATTPYNMIGWIGLNFLLFRFHLQAGASKLLSKDKTWRDLSAISYHYQTQPLPNTTAWYIHKLPLLFHKISAFLMFVIEIVVPFFIFAPKEVRLGVFVLLAGLQATIWFTGNLSYLNHLTFAVCIILIQNSYLDPFFGSFPPLGDPTGLLWNGTITVLAAAFLLLQIVCCIIMFFPGPKMQKIMEIIRPFHLAYPHGIFSIMTTKRYEMIIQGSHDGSHWQEYHFYYKPGDVSWRPRRISPYQPRIDWQAWFLPFNIYERQFWFQQFLVKLLLGTPCVTKLLKYNPFAEKPPRFIRVLTYDYEFTTFEERAKTGNWWKRRLVGEYAPSMRLLTEEEKNKKPQAAINKS